MAANSPVSVSRSPDRGGVVLAYRIFISHGWRDRWLAEQIGRRIRSDCGAEVFIDAFDLVEGDDIEERIFAELPGCDELLVLVTPWSADRNWIWAECGAARALGKRIVPVLYEVTLDALDNKHGGSTFLRSKLVTDINEMESYLQNLAGRVKGRSTQ